MEGEGHGGEGAVADRVWTGRVCLGCGTLSCVLPRPNYPAPPAVSEIAPRVSEERMT